MLLILPQNYIIFMCFYGFSPQSRKGKLRIGISHIPADIGRLLIHSGHEVRTSLLSFYHLMDFLEKNATMKFHLSVGNF